MANNEIGTSRIKQCLFCGRVVIVSPGYKHECVFGGHACLECAAACAFGACQAAK